MESKTKILGHAAHAMVIVWPLGLLSTALIFDGLAAATRKPKFSEAAFWMLISGLVGGAVAAPLGYNDWVHIPEGTRAKDVGRRHGLSNAAALALFGVSALLRRGEGHKPTGAALALGRLGGGLAMAGGWLGGELVERLRIGVDDNAHEDAPSSLSGLPAGENPKLETED